MVFIMSMVPIVELKGAIPFGVAVLNVPFWQAFTIAEIGCAIPVPFIIYLWHWGVELVGKIGFLKRFADWVAHRAVSKSSKIMNSRFTYLALFVFVAIPLPTTGVWTGSVIAALFGLDKTRSIIAILLGNIVAGLLMLQLGIFASRMV